MSDITARVPLIDWQQGFPKHWNDNKPAATHAFNALSFMFPQGERFFIKSAKEVSELEGLVLSPELQADVKAFVLQEAAHTKHHQLYNQTLEAQGYANVAHGLMATLENIAHRYLSPLQKLAVVCAYEHYTAILGDFLLKKPVVLAAAPQQMSLVWEWHAAEETEHKAVCFDLYKAAGGSWALRAFALIVVTFEFLLIFMSLYCNMLWRDGCFRLSQLPQTLCQSTKFFWGRNGVGWHVLWHAPQYLRPSFHPWKQDNRQLLKNWLSRNAERLSPLKSKK